MADFKKSDRVLIVGGTGFIGMHLARRCIRDTPHVVCIGLRSDLERGVNPAWFETLNTDIVNKKKLKTAICNNRFDYVFNLSGYIDHVLYSDGGRMILEAHFIGLMNLIDCIDKNKIKGFVQIGTSDEYGSAAAPQKETLREMPFSPYSLAKTAASHFIQMLNRTEAFPGVVLRLFLVYGQGQKDDRFLPQAIKACLRNEIFPMTDGKQIRDFCYIDDIVEAIVRAAVTPRAMGEILNIASGVPVTVREVMAKIVHIIGCGRPVFGARPHREGENRKLYADISKAKKILGWSPRTSLEDGLIKTIDYYKKRMC